jgi:hypothetical protein
MDAHQRRAIECVNACAGLPDPSAAIQAARNALQACEHSDLCEWRFAKPCDCGRDKAIELLTKQP